MNSYKLNKLHKEKSPYLLQHARNPVDWFPWGEEAFQKAKESDKPIFLSIGYSTCHWCHVMEHESFEDTEVALHMNNSFISVKVDREERPDIDHVYMSVCQMMTGGGGWPLTIVMTPDKKPFFAGTYFPKESRGGRIGLLELIDRVNDVWNNQRNEVYQSADKITDYLQNDLNQNTSNKTTDNLPESAFQSFKRLYDTVNGGFGTAPKFPSPHNLLFLLRHYHSTGSTEALDMVEKTLTNMSQGGITDHIGYGFHRYSTDQKWLLPHFEKMLYDQATISYLLVELYSITKKNLYKDIADKIFQYVQDSLLSEDGFFYSAEDADSEGIEGKFYTWKTEELKALLNEDDYKLFSTVYNIDPEGNFEHEATRQKDGSNIPYLSNSYETIADQMDLSISELEKRLEDIRKILLESRNKRIRPLRDDKMLTDWNALMIASFAYASRVFGNDEYLLIADKATSFLLDKMVNNDFTVLHNFNDGISNIHGKLDDYSFLIFALLEMYNASLNPKYLINAVSINDKMIDLFLDSNSNGFYLTSRDDETLITRPKSIYDSAIPSGNSLAMINLMRISHLTGNTKYNGIVDKYLNSLTGHMSDNPLSFSMLLTASVMKDSKSKELIITDSKHDHTPVELAKVLSQNYNPYLYCIYLTKESQSDLMRVAKYLGNYEVEEENKYYLCENYNCELPENDLDKIIEKL